MNETMYTDNTELDLQASALKIPPHSIEAEQAVLGGVMLENTTWERVVELLSEPDFYRHDHRLMKSLIARA